MKLVYFSWIRERLNKNEEEVALPDSITNLGQLKEWMVGRDEIYAHVFEHADVIRVAIDQTHVDDDACDISGAKEIAFFPPMTGG